VIPTHAILLSPEMRSRVRSRHRSWLFPKELQSLDMQITVHTDKFVRQAVDCRTKWLEDYETLWRNSPFHLDGDAIRYLVLKKTHSWWVGQAILCAPFFIFSQYVDEALLLATDWQAPSARSLRLRPTNAASLTLVIVDEAHHICNTDKQWAYRYQCVISCE